MTPSFLYHGSCNGEEILDDMNLIPMSAPEYSFEAPDEVLCLTRSFNFAASYANQYRDTYPTPMVFIFDRQLLRTTHKITIARSTFFDSYSGYNRDECEEFVSKPISLHHPAYIGYIDIPYVPWVNDPT